MACPHTHIQPHTLNTLPKFIDFLPPRMERVLRYLEFEGFCRSKQWITFNHLWERDLKMSLSLTCICSSILLRWWKCQLKTWLCMVQYRTVTPAPSLINQKLIQSWIVTKNVVSSVFHPVWERNTAHSFKNKVWLTVFVSETMITELHFPITSNCWDFVIFTQKQIFCWTIFTLSCSGIKVNIKR